MEIKEQIETCYKSAGSYPELVKGLIGIGMESYTVLVSDSTILYRFANGKNFLHPGNNSLRTIALKFDEQKTIQAIRNNQQKKTGYPQFMNEIAEAGVLFYEATLNGENKRVTYIGTGGFYEEAIPL